MSEEFSATFGHDNSVEWQQIVDWISRNTHSCRETQSGAPLRFYLTSQTNSWGCDGEAVLKDNTLIVSFYAGSRDQMIAIVSGLNEFFADVGINARLEEL